MREKVCVSVHRTGCRITVSPSLHLQVVSHSSGLTFRRPSGSRVREDALPEKKCVCACVRVGVCVCPSSRPAPDSRSLFPLGWLFACFPLLFALSECGPCCCFRFLSVLSGAELGLRIRFSQGLLGLVLRPPAAQRACDGNLCVLPCVCACVIRVRVRVRVCM